MSSKKVILYNLVLLAISAILLGSAVSVAWFQYNRKVDIAGISISAKDSNRTVQCELLYLTSDGELQQEPMQSDLLLDLPPYDSFIPEKNINTKRLVVFTISGQDFVSACNRLSLTLIRHTVNSEYPISAVTHYGIVAVTSLPGTVEEFNNICEVASTAAKEFAGQEQLCMQLSEQEISSVVNNNSLTVLLYIDYDETLIEANFGSLDVCTETDGGIIQFVNDVVEVIIQ